LVPGDPDPFDGEASFRFPAKASPAVWTEGLDIVATVIRQDGHWARLHNDAHFACANFAYDHGLDKPG
jgi:hypothetical protein